MGIKAMSASSKTQSYWMLQDAGENLFRVAKERVFRVIQTQSAEGDTPVWRLTPVLEHKPKERLLLEVLTEIERRWNEKLRKSQSGNGGSLSSIAVNTNVLLMVKDERALRSVRTYLTHGGKENRAAAQNFLNYLDQVQQKVKSIIRTGGHDLDSMPTEQRLLYEEHSRLHNSLFGSEKMDQYSKIVEEDRTKLTQWKKKRKIMIEDKARGSVTADAIRQQAYLDEAVEQSRGNSGMEAVLQMKDGERESSDEESTGWSSDDEDELAYKVEPAEGLKLFIRTFSKVSEGEASLILQDIRPTYVIMYDSDPSFIRTLEIFSATMTNSGETHPTNIPKEDRLQVYFLLYEASAEDIVFSSSLDREKEAFDALIEHHKRMPTTLSSFNNFSTTQEMQQSSGFGGSYSGGMLPLSMDTRTGGGKTNSSKERRDIAVDVR
jgi:DNA excision repair protein ERCC-4